MDAEEMLNTSFLSDSRCVRCSIGSYGNDTNNCPQPAATGHVIVTSAVLALITMATVVGNLLVMASVFLERSLRTVANLLIVSLSATDLLVALLVMPLSAVNQVEGCWILGPEACSAWIFFDVLCCTSSIYHLVAIAFDRLWAVSKSDYIHNRSSRRILVMIGLSWVLSAFIGAPPLLGWTSPHGSDLDRTGQCLISQDLAYTIFSTVGAFYLPLVAIVVVYAKVYQKARDRILKRHFKASAGDSLRSARTSSASCCSTRKSTITDDDRPVRMDRLKSEGAMEAVPLSSCLSNCQVADRLAGDATQQQSCRIAEREKRLATGDTDYPVAGSPATLSTMTLCAGRGSVSGSSVDLSRRDGGPEAAAGAETLRTSSGRCAVVLSPGAREKTFRRKIEQKRERKAARTLTVVTGTFVCCWLPFFIVATLRPICGQRCQFPYLLTSVILWLGYVNSLLNPMIYTLFNPDFRNAFRKILLGKYRC